MSSEADKNAIAKAAKDFNGRWTPQVAKDYNNSGDKRRTGFEKLARHVSSTAWWERALDHRLSGPVGLIAGVALNAFLSGSPAPQGPTELEKVNAENQQLKVAITQLRSRPPTSNFVANETLHLVYNSANGQQTAYIPARLLMEKSSFALPGQTTVPFEQGLEIIGNIADEKPLGNVLVLDTNSKWASTVGTQVDEELLKTPELRAEFIRQINIMKSDIPNHDQNGAQPLNYYFKYDVSVNGKIQLYRDPGEPGGNDVAPIPEV